MEHRMFPRTSISLEVLLYHDGLPIAVAKAVNISMDGMLIKVKRDPGFIKNASYEIEFAASVYGEQNRYRIPAMLVHDIANKAGFLFETSNEETSDVLNALIERETAR